MEVGLGGLANGEVWLLVCRSNYHWKFLEHSKGFILKMFSGLVSRMF